MKVPTSICHAKLEKGQNLAFQSCSCGAQIGDNCSIGQNVVVAGTAKIGHGVKIQNNVSIYDGVELGDNVFCGPSMVFTNVINPRSAVSRRSEYKPTIVGPGVTFGANSTIVCGNTIGEYAFIGAGAVITKDVPAYALMVGVPAKQIGWMSRFGERLELPLQGEATATCPHTNERYILSQNQLQVESISV